MTRPYNTPHLYRGKSSYRKKGKHLIADRYGNFDNGQQKSHDKIAGANLWYPREDKDNG